MKKISVMLILCLLCLMCACSKEHTENNEALYGEQEIQATQASKENIATEPQEKEPETVIEEPTHPAQIGDIDAFLTSIGAVKCETSNYYEEAVSFADAIMNKNLEKIAELTGGHESYYEDLKELYIAGYNLIPFELTSEKTAEMEKNWVYTETTGNYLIEFDVKLGNEAFPKGKTVYFAGLELNTLSGSCVGSFVPAGDTEKFLFVEYTYDKNDEYMERFIREFTTICGSQIAEGKNYPDFFSFTSEPHFITHLMVNCGKYPLSPPYTLDEINDYISCAFDGATEIAEHIIDYGAWLYSSELPVDDRMFGCSAAHGLATAEHKIIDIKSEGNSRIYTVDVYADYSNFAKAHKLIYYFDLYEDSIPKLTMIELRENTYRETAVNSI